MFAHSEVYKRFVAPNRLISKDPVLLGFHHNALAQSQHNQRLGLGSQNLTSARRGLHPGSSFIANHRPGRSSTVGEKESESTGSRASRICPGVVEVGFDTVSAVVGDIMVVAVADLRVAENHPRAHGNKRTSLRLGQCLFTPNKDMTDLAAWQAALEHELDLARMKQREEGSSAFREVSALKGDSFVELGLGLGLSEVDQPSVKAKCAELTKPLKRGLAPRDMGQAREKGTFFSLDPFGLDPLLGLSEDLVSEEKHSAGGGSKKLKNWKGKGKWLGVANISVRRSGDLSIDHKKKVEGYECGGPTSNLRDSRKRSGDDSQSSLPGGDELQPIASWVQT
ncbi:hypothetical protein CJ030_MR5G001860 [Morella rubra]|uniref:Uncharacterized protein n=1 Tax=Morella rubra TaxID=262757 RepID=A0A6A1VMC6_9ROSI|nr:hypothetical protein CJ030_MR5G001860 [Morella rubra]